MMRPATFAGPQVSTRLEKVEEFFAKLTAECVRRDEPFIAVVEVYRFNDWLFLILRDYRCHHVTRIQPKERKKRKTDRRDAAAGELLWSNRDRFLGGKPCVASVRSTSLARPTRRIDD